MKVAIESIPCGPTQTNCYLLSQDGQCALVDPGFSPGPVLRQLSERQLQPKLVLLTHGHCDHIAGIDAVREAFPSASVLCPRADAVMLTDAEKNMSALFGFPTTASPADRLIDPGETIEAAGASWRVLDTSGHTPGGVSFYCDQIAIALVGDAVFAGSIGRTDLPGSDSEALLRNIRDRLLSLPGETRLLPGHGPETTVQAELDGNPFLENS